MDYFTHHFEKENMNREDIFDDYCENPRAKRDAASVQTSLAKMMKIVYD